MPPVRISVLLVDDHLVVRNGVRMMLSLAGDIDVTGEAENAQQALQLLRKQHFDVALVDIAMPDCSGLDLIKLMRAQRPETALLTLSMYDEEIYAVRALKNGAAGYLTKNSSPQVLAAAVRKAADGGHHVSFAVMEQLATIIGGGGRQLNNSLSNRELEVLRLIAAGKSLVDIAQILHLSPSTVTTYRMRILEKVRLQSNAELTRYALENGLLL